MADPPLFILSTMRSFTSLVSTMLGQHPQAYGFPELNLFVADTLGAVIDFYRPNRPHGLDGLTRAVAELEFGGQTDDTVTRATAWIDARRDWPTRRMMDHLLAAVAPRIGVDKSPVTVREPAMLRRLLAQYPDASLLHLVRHPRAVCHSIQRFHTWLDAHRGSHLARRVRPEEVWVRTNRVILEETRRLPPGQVMRLQGERLLADPDRYLPQIAEWLGLDSGPQAVAAMLHPEASPYACVGPAGAGYGNDPNFLTDPVFHRQTGPVARPDLDSPLDWEGASGVFSRDTLKLAREFGYT